MNMLKKHEYRKVTNIIRDMNKKQIKRLCDEVNLSQYEKNILNGIKDKDKIDEVCIKNYISTSTFNNHSKILLNKVYYFYNKKEIN